MKEFKAPARELAGWISRHLANVQVHNAYVLFAGLGQVALRLRDQGWQIMALDTLHCHHLLSCAFLLEGAGGITEENVVSWMRLRKEPEIAGRFFSWANQVFTPEEAVWLGIWRANILESDQAPNVQAQGSAVVLRTMAYWLSWNRTELTYKSLPPAAVFRHYVAQINREAAFGNRQNATLLSPIGAIPQAANADLLYCYVPPCQGMGAMDARLPYWERWVLGDPIAPLPFEERGQLGGLFSRETDWIAAVVRLLGAMKEIPVWAIAYSGDGEQISSAVSSLRPIVSQHEIPVPYPGPDGTVINQENLIIAG
ncbi:MAG: hypothetical protein HY692_01875 [Cyanobacteria bacterium NC_groundwater_1444_Ag_S-0.65um_54_12]|nr:hypothetical protein [Cyanobacteria bacterium NC_groundwater_1444_Ag_S-0.65um_54_12]